MTKSSLRRSSGRIGLEHGYSPVPDSPASASAGASSSDTVEKSIPFGEYSRTRPFVFSSVPRFHGWACSAEVELYAQLDGDVNMLDGLLPLSVVTLR